VRSSIHRHCPCAHLEGWWRVHHFGPIGPPIAHWNWHCAVARTQVGPRDREALGCCWCSQLEHQVLLHNNKPLLSVLCLVCHRAFVFLLFGFVLSAFVLGPTCAPRVARSSVLVVDETPRVSATNYFGMFGENKKLAQPFKKRTRVGETKQQQKTSSFVANMKKHFYKESFDKVQKWKEKERKKKTYYSSFSSSSSSSSSSSFRLG